MRKIRRFKLTGTTVLSSEDLVSINGGTATYTCNTGGSCSLFISTLGITVSGTCVSSFSGNSVTCYCKNGYYQSSNVKKSVCWR
jgi:hypothetical protein